MFGKSPLQMAVQFTLRYPWIAATISARNWLWTAAIWLSGMVMMLSVLASLVKAQQDSTSPQMVRAYNEQSIVSILMWIISGMGTAMAGVTITLWKRANGVQDAADRLRNADHEKLLQLVEKNITSNLEVKSGLHMLKDEVGRLSSGAFRVGG